MDEHEALIGGGHDSRRRSKESGGGRGGVLINRVLLLLLLAAFVAASVYYQSQISTLQGQLTQEEKTIHDLQDQVQKHDVTIQRFNQSVTNSDVMTRLKSLEKNLDKTQANLENEMDTLQSRVSTQLNNTLRELGDTVANAKKEISEQVEKMKHDFDQYVVTTQDQFSMENSFMVYQIAGTLVLLCCLISMWHMTAHLRKLQEPVVQRKILAILWMSPIYAVTSWFSLVFHSAEGYLAIIKDGYEAYIIYQFLSFCIAVIGKGDRSKVVEILAKRADHLSPPFTLRGCCSKVDPYKDNPRALADDVLLQCQLFGMQFVFLRPMLTIANVVMAKMNYYGLGTGPHDYRSPQFYIMIIQNFSVFLAFAGLLKFYHAVDEELQWCRPFAKFLCIKGVVFLTFWQGMAIAVLAETTDVGGEQSDEWAKSSQNFLICLEMLLFSIAHFYCFPTDEWSPDYRRRAKAGFTESLALGDFVQDLKLLLRSKKKKSKPPAEPTVPEGDEESTDDETDNKSAISSLTNGIGEDIERGDLERLIEERIREIGDDAYDDDEVKQARKRLASLSAVTDSERTALDAGKDEEVQRARKCLESLAGVMSSGDSEGSGIAAQKSSDGGEKKNWTGITSGANETTGLLTNRNDAYDGASSSGDDDEDDDDDDELPRTKNEEVLKPSIFTHIGGILSPRGKEN